MANSTENSGFQKALDLLDKRLAGARDFVKADLKGVVLTQAILGDIILDAADLSEGSLERVNLQEASLKTATLDRANLKQAFLSDSNFEKASLQETNLQGADLANASLMLADLSGADLSHATLTKANLQGANLRGARLESANLQGAIYNEFTRFDPDVNPIRVGMQKFEGYLDQSLPDSQPEGTPSNDISLESAPTADTSAQPIYYRGALTNSSTMPQSATVAPTQHVSYRGASAQKASEQTSATQPSEPKPKRKRYYRGVVYTD